MSEEKTKLVQVFDTVILAKAWKAAISSINGIVEDALMSVSQDGIHFRGMDPGHHLFVDFNWSKDNFVKYEVQGLDKIAFRVEDVVKILGRVNADDNLSVYLKDAHLHFETSTKNFFSRCIEPYFAETPIPKAKQRVAVKVPMSKFKDAIDDIKVVSKHITVSSENGKVYLSGKDLDTKSGGAKVEMLDPDVDLLDDKVTFSADFTSFMLSDMAKYTDEITIMFDKDSPLLLVFHIEKLGEIHFWVAPIQGGEDGN